MKSRDIKTVTACLIMILFPWLTQAQGVAGEIHSLQSVLDELYDDMIPLCSQLIGVGQGIAGFAALWYIASRVWRSIANAEPIDFYPLLRPFALGLAIMLFPYVLSVMNAVLRPTVTGTAAMMTSSNNAITYLLKQKEEAIKKTVTWQLYGDEGTHGKWYKYMYPDGEEETGVDLLSNGIKFMMTKALYGIQNAVKQWLSEILQIVYEAAALCINTIRTFYLIVLAILGPLVIGFSVFDGFQNTLIIWIARYINVFLWLPVANIFGSIIAKIQENMLRLDIEQIEMYGDTSFSAADTGYIIFLIIGIIGYFTIPSVANYIIHAGGDNHLLAKSSNLFTGSTIAATSMVGGSVMSAGRSMTSGSSSGSNSTQANNAASQSDTSNNYQHDKLSGK
jgi:conjugative transposon TraJ protein